MWSGQWPGPEPAGSGRAWASNMTIVLRAGPGLDILFAGRAGPHNSVCGPGPGRVSTTASRPGRAWASNHICGPGLGLNFRPVPCSRLIVQNNEAIDPLRWSVDGTTSTGDVVCRLFSTTLTAVVRGQSPAQHVSPKSANTSP